MKTLNTTLSLISIILLFIVIFQCSNPQIKTVEIKIPSKENKFTSINLPSIPIVKKEVDTIYLDGKEIIIKEKVNDSLLNKYLELENKYERLNLFLNTISYSKFNETFTDDFISINVNGIARGKVKELNLTYKTFPYTKSLEIPKNRKLYGTLEIGLPLSEQEFNLKTNLILIDKKENIYSFGVDLEQRIYIGTGFKF